jgi:hypothetical protein
MALDFFRIERGLELDEKVQYLTGAGLPGAGGDSAVAPVGSFYTDNVNGEVFSKHSVGTGVDKWERIATEAYVNNAVGATISWRQPVVVNDTTSLALPAGVAGQPVVVDTISIANGDRVLFAALPSGGKNVYIYNQATGTFAEDVNQETNGDALYVQQGTDAGKQFVFNGTDWVQSAQASLDELGFIRTFIGKATAGAETPSYASNNIVLAGTSLEAAVGALDTQIGATVAGNYIALNQTVFGAVTALDTAIGANVVTGNYILDTNKVQANISALDAAIGPNVSNGTYILAANKVQANIAALDAAVGIATLTTTATNVTTTTTIDTAPVGATVAKWFIRCVQAADPANVYATEVYALANDAVTASDFTRYGTLKLGISIPGLVITVGTSGGALILTVAAGAGVNVTARRASVI